MALNLLIIDPLIHTLYEIDQSALYVLLYVSHNVRDKVKDFLLHTVHFTKQRYLYENKLCLDIIREGHMTLFNFIINTRLDTASIFNLAILLDGNIVITCDTGKNTLTMNTTNNMELISKKLSIKEHWETHKSILSRFDCKFITESIFSMFMNSDKIDASILFDTIKKILKVSTINNILTYLFKDYKQHDHYVYYNDIDFLNTGLVKSTNMFMRIFEYCIYHGKVSNLLGHAIGENRSLSCYDNFIYILMVSIYTYSKRPISTFICMISVMMEDGLNSPFRRIIKRSIFALYNLLNRNADSLLIEFRTHLGSNVDGIVCKFYLDDEYKLCSEESWKKIMG